MDTFEYLTVFVSIILGLGMTYVIMGVGKLLLLRKRFEFYWIHILQIISTFLMLLSIWWVTYSWTGMRNLSFLNYLFLMCPPVVIVLASSLLFPAGRKKNNNLKEHYFSICRPYYILMSLTRPLDLLDTLLKGPEHFTQFGWSYVLVMVVSFFILLSAAFYRKPAYHGFVQIYFITTVLFMKFLFVPTLESFTG